MEVQTDSNTYTVDPIAEAEKVLVDAKVKVEELTASLKSSKATLKVAKTYSEAMTKAATADAANVEAQAEAVTAGETLKGWQAAVDSTTLALTSAKVAVTTAAANVKALKKTTKAPKPVVERDERNGQRKPSAGTSSDKLWAVYDAVAVAKGSAPALEDVMEKARETGIVDGTIKAAYAHWRKYHGVTGRVVSDAKLAKEAADKAAAEAKAAEKVAAKAAKLAPPVPTPTPAPEPVA